MEGFSVRGKWVGALMCVGLVWAMPATAGIKWSASAAAVTVDTPDVKATLNAADSPQGSAGGKLSGVAASVTATIDLGRGLGIGTEPRLQVTAGWLNADDKYSDQSTTGAYGFMPVDGSGTSNGGSGSNLAFDTEVKQGRLDVMLREQMGKGPCSWSLFGGLALAQSKLTHAFSGNVATTFLNDEIKTNYYGVAGGVDSVYTLTQHFFVISGARLDLLAASSDLAVSQQINSTSYAASDKANGFASKLGAHIGVAYKVSHLTLGLIVSANYLSDAFTVEHPLYDAEPFASHLKKDAITSYGVNLGTSLSF